MLVLASALLSLVDGIDPDALAKTLGILFAFEFQQWHPAPHWLLFTAVVLAGYSVLTAITQSHLVFGRCQSNRGPLEVRAKRLENEDLRWTDYAFVTTNKLITVYYVYFGVTVIRAADWVDWSATEAHAASAATNDGSNGVMGSGGWAGYMVSAACHIATVLVSLGCYDLVYVPFHRLLHVPALYPLIHKHHHRQAVPFRGTFDGINVHPFEFAFGEFLHIGALWMTSQVARLILGPGARLPIYGCLAFLVTGGLMASLNHTRFSIRIPGVYDVRTHDVHHRKPRSNYCQFVPWFDKLYGSFEAYKTSEEARAERRAALQRGGKGTLLDARSLQMAREEETMTNAQKTD